MRSVKVSSSLSRARVWNRCVGALRPRCAKALGVRQCGLFIGPNICAVANFLLAARRFDEPGLCLVESFPGLRIAFAVVGLRISRHCRYLGVTFTLSTLDAVDYRREPAPSCVKRSALP